MEEHVDFVRTDLANEATYTVGRVMLNDRVIEIDVMDKAYYDLVTDAIPQTARLLGVPDIDAFQALHERFHGPYLFATVPHTKGDCSFGDGEPMKLTRDDKSRLAV